MKASIHVIKYYVKDSNSWWQYWICKLILRYHAGRATVSDIAGLLKKYCALDAYTENVHKLRARLSDASALFSTCVFRDELSIIPHSDQALLEKLYGAGIERDYIKIADESMHSITAFKRAIVQGVLQHHYFRSMRLLAADLSMSYGYVKKMSVGLEKRTVYAVISDRNDLPYDEARKIARLARSEDDRCYASAIKGTRGYSVITPVGVHAKRVEGYKHFNGRGLEQIQRSGKIRYIDENIIDIRSESHKME